MQAKDLSYIPSLWSFLGLLFEHDIRTMSAVAGPRTHSKPDILFLISIRRRKYHHISASTKDNRE